MTDVPGVGHTVYRGDLGLPAPLAVAIGALELVFCAAVAACLTRSRMARSQRPILAPQQAGGWRAVPLGFSIGTTVGGAALGSRAGGALMLVGFLLALLSLPLAGPTLLPGLGAWLARARPVAALLAGRRLQADPRRTGRPFAFYGVTVLLAMGTGCYVALLDAPEPTALPRGDDAAVSVRWTDPSTDDLARLRRQLPAVDVIAMSETEHGEPTLATTCRQLAATLTWLRCTAARIEPSDADRLAALLALPPSTPIRFARRQPRPTAAVVVGSQPLSTLEARTRIAAQRTLTAWSVMSPLSQKKRPSTLNPWLTSGLRIAVVALALAGLLLVIDAVLRARRSNAVLQAIGMSPHQHAQLEATLFALPFWTITALSGLTGLLFAGLFTSVTEAPLPLRWLVSVLGLALAGGLVGAVIVARFGRHNEPQLAGD